MKKYLFQPDVNWYRANLHCHTIHSDGRLTPEEVKKAYKEQGYSIIAYSDHEVIVEHPELNDENFLALTACELGMGNWDDSFPEPEVDKGKWKSMHRKTFHLNIFSKTQKATPIEFLKNTLYGFQHQFFEGTDEELQKKKLFTYENVNEVIAKCNEAGYLVQLNHPFWSLNTRDDYLGLRGLWSLEILNYATELETGSEYCPYIYDDMLRFSNPNLRCAMGDDNHRIENQAFGGSTIIGAKELTYEAIIDALEKGHFYCSSGVEKRPEIRALYVEDGKVKIDCSPATEIIYLGYPRVFKNTYGDGITHAEFDLNPGDVYFHLIVRDEYNNRAHTQNYMIKDLI